MRSVSGKTNITKGRDPNATSATARFGNRKGYLFPYGTVAERKNIGIWEQRRNDERKRDRERGRGRGAERETDMKSNTASLDGVNHV